MLTSLDVRRLRWFLSVGFVFCLTAMNAEAAIITGETVTASSQFQGGGFPAIRTVDNSGITGSGSLATDGDFVDDNVQANNWLSLHTAHGGTGSVGQTLTINLGALYDVDGMRIWNYQDANAADSLAGVASYQLETSPDGSTWTTQIASAALAAGTGANGYVGSYTAVNWSSIQYARLTVLTAHRPDVVGLGEIMFSGTVPVPEPGSMIIAISGLGLSFVARRRYLASRVL